MFRINTTTKQIELTRGDVAAINVTAKAEDGSDYVFLVGDIVRFKVFKNKDCGCVELQKDEEVTEQCTSVSIELTGEDNEI